MRSAASSAPRLLTRGLLALGVALLLELARSADAAPQLLAIRGATVTNVTDTSFSVNWDTDQPLPGSGSVRYGTSPTSLTFGTTELTPVSGARGDVHSVSVRSLTPGTSYYFSVVEASVTDNNNGSFYLVTTGPTLPNLSSGRFASGKILQEDGRTAAAGVLVTIRLLDTAGLNGTAGSSSAPLSTIADAQGNWTIALSPRTADNANVFNFAATGSAFLSTTVDGGGLGAIWPAQSIAVALDNTGKMTVPPMVLGTGLVPTDTPTTVGSTVTATATATGTTPATPIASTTPAEPAGGTPRAPTPTLTAVPTRSPVVIPTVAPVPTQVQPPPVETTPLPTRLPPTPTRAIVPPPVLVVSTIATIAEPAAPPASTPTLTIVAGAGPFRPTVRPTPPRPTPSLTPTAMTATPSVPTSGTGGPTAGATPASPLQSVLLVLAAGLGLIGLGLAISVIGFVDQRRDG
ncbi:MAG TPA: fibronectin type III domain-containing protein [Chloroflexota bacterium]|nr:fibronectin type III domain-containing protein [Chloroflexota bacterium]